MAATDYVTIQYKRGKRHAVSASGGPADGSLFGFATRCGRIISDLSDWTERDGEPADCAQCLRSLAREERFSKGGL